MITIRSIQPEEIGAVLDLIQQAFTYYTDTPNEENGTKHYALFADVYSRADIDTDLIIVAEEAGKFVSMVSFLPKTIRMGEQEIPGVILSPAGTLLEHRKQKLADRVIRYGVELAQQKGYVFSNVLGHPDYYPRFGYTHAFPWYKLVKECGESAESVEVQELEVRPYRDSDLEAITAIYRGEMEKHRFFPVRTADWFEREFAVMTGREAERQRTGHAFSSAEDFLVFVRDGEVIGYAYLGELADKLVVKECLIAQYADAANVYQALLQTARTRGKATLEYSFPAVTNFGLYMKVVGAQEIVHAPSAWMMQVLNWQTWFDAYGTVTPLAVISGQPVQFDVQTVGEGLLQLRLECGDHVVECRLAEAVLNKLVFGLHAVEELQAMGQIEVLEGETAILAAVFPKGSPYFNINDCLF